jgi:hypothetical protein
MMSTDPSDVGRAFAEALSSKDREALTSIIDPAVDFRGLTPGREWRATSPDEVAEIVFGSWFEPTDRIVDVLDVRTRDVADRHHVLYRFRVENEDGVSLVEQQGYYDTTPAGRIARMSMVCSGYRPWEGDTAG